MIDLKGFKQIIPARKGRVSKYANCLLVLEKSKRFSLGKELYDKYKLDKQKKAGLYIKKAKQFYEIIVGFKDDEMFMLSKTPGIRGFVSATAFQLCPTLQGVYEPVESGTTDGEFYIRFEFRENI
jgi:hypothetical protein